MKQHRNPILNGTLARIRQLLEQYEESKSITHASTVGSLREAYLKQFISGFIPLPFLAKSGFVTDSRGMPVSPQLDLVVFDQTSVPAFALSEFVSLIPLEAARVAIEVKSRLKSADFRQLQLQQATFRSMRYSWTSPGRRYLKTTNCENFPQVVVAFDSDCAVGTFERWLNEESGLDAICVIGREIVIRNPSDGTIETIKSNKDGLEVLHLVSYMQKLIQLAQAAFSHPPPETVDNETIEFYSDIGAYLTFDVPYPEPGDE